MSKVIEAWEQVLRGAISQDYDEQQFALLQIAYVLQRHNPKLKLESDAAEESLSRDLLRLALDESRQRDTVIYLTTLVRKHPKQADSFFYAMSNAQAKVLAEPLVELLLGIGKKLNKDAIFQALLALENLVKQAGDSLQDVFKQYDILPLLEDWAEHSDKLIANKADILADKVLDLIGEDE